MINPPLQPDEELRDKLCVLMIGAHYEDLSSHDKADVDEAMLLVQAREQAARIEARTQAMADKFKDYLEGLDVTEAVHLIGVTMYLYCMEATNATEFKFTLTDFNKSGKVLGDMTVSANLTPSNRNEDSNG